MPGGLSLARYVFDKGRLRSGAARGRTLCGPAGELFPGGEAFCLEEDVIDSTELDSRPGTGGQG